MFCSHFAWFLDANLYQYDCMSLCKKGQSWLLSALSTPVVSADQKKTGLKWFMIISFPPFPGQNTFFFYSKLVAGQSRCARKFLDCAGIQVFKQFKGPLPRW